MKKLIRLILLLIPHLAFGAPPSHVIWEDDFLGLNIDSKYSQSLSGTGGIDIATFTNGAARLYALSDGAGVARLRFGDSGNSPYDARNWDPCKTILFEARVFFNLNTDMQATVGFVGLNDPDNVLAAILDTSANPQWIFQARSRINGTQYGINIPTGFLHTPGAPVDFKIVTSDGPNPEAFLFINEELVASAQFPQVPISDLTPEFQVWNRLVGKEWSQITMWIDWFFVQQER